MSLGEVTGAWPVTVIWVLLFVSAAAAYVYHKFVGPSLRGKRPFRVESIIRETHNVWTITLAPPEGREQFEYLPGQFQFLTFLRGSRLRGEEHPFTISSSPGRKGFHASTIKESGDFTRTIGETRAGDLVAVQAPFGRFSYLLHPGERDLVFIAGGVGITPLMSMLRHMRDMDADKEVLLLYANSTEQDILFRDELDRIASAERPRLSVVHVLSKAAPEWRGERGHIDQAVIRKYCRGDLEGKSFYLCGPPAMMTALIAAVIDLGVPSRRVRSERFAL
jgi:ferredoxin-NADP reductase